MRFGDFRVFAGDAFYTDVEDALRLSVMRMVCEPTSEVAKLSQKPLREGRFKDYGGGVSKRTASSLVVPFANADESGRGTLGSAAFRDAMKSLEFKLPKRSLSRLERQLDALGDGKLAYAEVRCRRRVK